MPQKPFSLAIIIFLIGANCFGQLKRPSNFPTEDKFKTQKSKSIEFNEPSYKYDTTLVSVFELKNGKKIIGRIKTVYAKNAIQIFRQNYTSFDVYDEIDGKMRIINVDADSIETAYIAAGSSEKNPNKISDTEIGLNTLQSIAFTQLSNKKIEENEEEGSNLVVLTNPMFSKKIKVFISPGVGTVSINNQKPFYKKMIIDYQGKTYLMTRKNYKEVSSILFESCGDKFKNYRTFYMSIENFADQVYSFENDKCN